MTVKKDEELVIEGFDDFETDPELEVNGSWRPLNDGTGREFLVAFAENPRYTAKLMKLMRPRMVQLKQNDENAFKLRDFLSGLAMPGTVLLGWRGGNLPKYSEELAKKLLTDRKYRKLRKQIEELAEDEESLLEGAEAEAVKN
jgi:hypothetical protein